MTTTTNTLVHCQSCNKEYKVRFPYEAKRRKYCSYDCYHLTLGDKWFGNNNPRWRNGGKEELICLHCKKGFIAKLSNTRKRKFCGKTCNAKHYSGSNNPKYSVKVKKVCIVCGKAFSRIKSQSESRFCSRKCYHGSMPTLYKGENASNWQGGKDDRKNVIRKTIYYRNWQKRVYKVCVGRCICGSKKKLETHHIIPMRDNIRLTFKVGNGILLCQPCHAKTFWREQEFAPLFNKILRDYTLNIRERIMI